MNFNIRQHTALMFDLGGVILNLSFEKTYRAFANLLAIDIERVRNNFRDLSFFKEFEIGKISSVAFRQNIRSLSNVSLTDKQIDDAWNAMLGELPITRIDVLRKLAESHRLILFSNTNEIHLEAFREICNGTGIFNFDSCFHAAYYSHLVGKRKPDVETYQWICTSNLLSTSDVLFFDDSEVNVEGAKQIGIKTVLVTDANELFERLAKQV